MEGIINLTQQALVAFAIYGAVVLAYTLLGAWKNINIWQTKWSWQKWLNGIVQYTILGVAVLTVLISAYSIVIVAPSWGVELQNAEQISTRVIFAIIAAGIIGMLLKCVGKIAEVTSTSKDVVEKIQKSAIDNPEGPVIVDVSDLPESVSSTEAEAELEKQLAGKTAEQIKLDLNSGRGAVASIPTGSPDLFRNAVINRAYDVDGYYGAQCWDGAALFWLNTTGRSFSSGGTGAARGGWEAARAANAGSEFELIIDRNKITKGDWLVFGGSQWGHVGMAMSGNLGNYVKLLGQNQTGTGNGAAFNEINMNLGNFLGAFRLKRWHVSPAPAPKPVAKPAPKVTPKPATPTKPVTKPKTTTAPTFQLGDKVVPTKLVDYTGTPLVKYDDSYTITQIKGDRAVLTARGVPWAAMNTANIRKI